MDVHVKSLEDIVLNAHYVRTYGVQGPVHAQMQSRLHMILSWPLTWEGQGLYHERTRKVCMLYPSGSKGKDKAKETHKSFLTATHVLLMRFLWCVAVQMLLRDTHTCLTNTTIRVGSVKVGWAPERKGADFFMILYDFGCFGKTILDECVPLCCVVFK